MLSARTVDGRLHVDAAATMTVLEPARQAVLAHLAPLALPAGLTYHVELVLEEILANIVHHAHGAAADAASHRVEITVLARDDEIELCFGDDGRPFDPLQRRAPVLPATLDEAQPGGLGLMLVKKVARGLRYERQGGRNLLTVLLARP